MSHESMGNISGLTLLQLMAEELKLAKARAAESNVQSSRSSLDMSPSPARMASPRNAMNLTPEGAAAAASGQMDYVYLKNVLLQFLEQRDKKHQMQLVPVLGMLLKFDRSVACFLVLGYTS